MTPPIPTDAEPSDNTERIYVYLCSYLENWIQPPLEEEIVQDLNLRHSQVTQALEELEHDGRLCPGSTMPKQSPGIEPLP